MKEESQATGYGIDLVGGKLRFHLTVRWLDDALRVETERALEPTRWHHVAVTYDASRLAAGVPPVAEAVPGFELLGWYGIQAPLKTPKPLIAKINAGYGLQIPTL